MNEQLEILTRGIVDLHVRDELEKKLARGSPLVIKAGFDPTAPDLHLGHTVLMTKMRQFQDLGHKVIFLIGDFTGRIGDPTGKNITRPALSDEDVIANAATYKKQVFKILDEKKTEVRFNSEWLGKMTLDGLIRVAAKYSVARMIERDDFRTRLAEGRPISMHELLYPLMQGYDSVVLKPDIELGGQDQLFNLLVGRDLMRHHGMEPQCVMTVPLLEGLSGGAKMGKSLGNYVGIDEDPQTQFGKLMSIADPLMWKYYELLSLKSHKEIEELRCGHPKEAKEVLALEIVSRFHNVDAAHEAKKQFHALFGAGKRNEIPEDAPVVKIAASEILLIHALVQADLAPSSAEAKRLLKQGAVSVNGERAYELNHMLVAGNYSVRAGKKRWAEIVVGEGIF